MKTENKEHAQTVPKLDKSQKREHQSQFWESKTLQDMSKEEWESLCDGCGRCCLNKIEFEDTQTVSFTNVACKLLDQKNCRCRDYPNRTKIVSDCIELNPSKVKSLDYLPNTCAYRLIATKKPLPSWHPLISKDKQSVHNAGISVRGKVISEEAISDDLEDYLIDWVKSD